jgi:predicted SAM-dependent methyltransferase
MTSQDSSKAETAFTNSEKDAMVSDIKRLIKTKLPFVSAAANFLVFAPTRLGAKRKVRRLLKERNDLMIEIGAGNKKGKLGWTTVDITAGCDLFWDLRRGLPFPDESVKAIYSSHLFEHLSYQEGQRLLDECKRVLVHGGSFSICVPNSRLYIEAYLGDKQLDVERFLGWKLGYNNTTKIDYVNYVGHLGGQHKYMFDEENLVHILKARGFKNVRPRLFDPELDLAERDHLSIYALADK